MATFLSPDVVIQERDDSTSNRAYGISTGVAVLASNFGPVLDPQLVNSEDNLVNIFGQPNDNNYKNWMSIANFLAYSDSCYAIRMETENQFNANAAGKTGWEVEQFENSKGMMVDVVDEDGDPVKHRVGLVINNDVDYAANYESGNGNFGEFAARYPGSIGNSIMLHTLTLQHLKTGCGQTLMVMFTIGVLNTLPLQALAVGLAYVTVIMMKFTFSLLTLVVKSQAQRGRFLKNMSI